MPYEKVYDQEQNGDKRESGITKWSVPGQTVEGTLTAKRRGKYGWLYDIGGMTYSGASVLDGKMQSIAEGSKVKVVYLGTRASQTPGRKPYHVFDVYVDRPISQQPVSVPSVFNVPRPAPLYQGQYESLYQQLVNEKGQVIADALKAATGLSNDPLGALRDAARQVGVEAVPF